jgi:hypothetical protein
MLPHILSDVVADLQPVLDLGRPSGLPWRLGSASAMQEHRAETGWKNDEHPLSISLPNRKDASYDANPKQFAG